VYETGLNWKRENLTYTTGRNETAPFAPPEHITSWMEKQFQELHKSNYLQNLPQKEFSQKAVNIINEINAAYPFIEGNERVQHVWLRLVVEHAGYSLDALSLCFTLTFIRKPCLL